MNNQWFTVTAKYTKQLENGSFKRVNEPYLLAAVSFADAEARIYEELGQLIRGEFSVGSIVRTEVHDIFGYDDSDQWFKVKTVHESIDVDSERSKKVNYVFFVSAENAKQAYDRIKESLSTLMVDFDVPSVSKSPIVEIFHFPENITEK